MVPVQRPVSVLSLSDPPILPTVVIVLVVGTFFDRLFDQKQKHQSRSIRTQLDLIRILTGGQQGEKTRLHLMSDCIAGPAGQGSLFELVIGRVELEHASGQILIASKCIALGSQRTPPSQLASIEAGLVIMNY